MFFTAREKKNNMAKTEIKKVIRVGNSYAVTISKPLLAAMGIKTMDYVVIRLTGEKLEIKRLEEGGI
jgi:antitoxin component of MazEF toxin-antitoxin module